MEWLAAIVDCVAARYHWDPVYIIHHMPLALLSFLQPAAIYRETGKKPKSRATDNSAEILAAARAAWQNKI